MYISPFKCLWFDAIFTALSNDVNLTIRVASHVRRQLRQGLWQNSTVVGGSLHQVVMNNIRTSAPRMVLIGAQLEPRQLMDF
jgi:hypothetical protein